MKAGTLVLGCSRLKLRFAYWEQVIREGRSNRDTYDRDRRSQLGLSWPFVAWNMRMTFEMKVCLYSMDNARYGRFEIASHMHSFGLVAYM